MGTTFDHTWRFAAAGCAALLLAAAVLWSGTLSGSAAGETLGVDPITDGNSATGLGTHDPCVDVNVDQQFDVDIYVTNVANLQAYDIRIGYDPALLEVIANNPPYFVNPIANESTVESPGQYLISLGSSSAASGLGVLARLRFHALANGFSLVSIKTNFPVAPYLSDNQNGYPGDTSGDGYFDGPVTNANVAVGTASCSGAPTPSPTPTPAPATPTPTRSPTPTPTPIAATPSPSPTPTFTPAPGSIPWGDMNCATGVTIDDAIFIAKLKAGVTVAPGASCPAEGEPVQGAGVNWGDFDCNHQFDLGDVIAILRYLIGITNNNVNCPLIATNYVFIAH